MQATVHSDDLAGGFAEALVHEEEADNEEEVGCVNTNPRID